MTSFLVAGFNDLCFSETSDELNSAVLISLFTWRHAKPHDLGVTDFQYGHWADSYDNHQLGSRLYLLLREKIDDDLPGKIDVLITEALQWMLDDSIISDISISSTRTDIYNIQTTLILSRHNQTTEKFEFDNIWELNNE